MAQERRMVGSAMAMAFALVMGGCAAPATKEDHMDGTANSYEKDTSPVTLTMTVVRNAPVFSLEDKPTARNRWMVSYPSAEGGDDISQALAALTGVTIRAETVDTLDAQLAAGALGDLVLACGYDKQLAREERCYALDTLSQAECPGFWENLDPMEKLARQQADGHVYALGQSSPGLTAYAGSPAAYRFENPIHRDRAFDPLAVRTDLMEQLSAQEPSSLEELEQMLREAARRKGELGIETPLHIDGIYADGIMTAEEWDVCYLDFMDEAYPRFPLAGCLGLRQEPYWDENSQRVRTPWRDESWLDYFLMLNRWYREGLLRYAAVDLLENTVYGEATWEPVTDALVYAGWDQDAAGLNALLREAGLGGRQGQPGQPLYQPLPAALTYQGNQLNVAADYGLPEFELYITKACGKPERAIRLMEFLRSPKGATLTQWGVEGEHYVLNEEGIPRYQAPYDDAAYRMMKMGAGRWDFLGSAWRADMLWPCEILETGDGDLRQDQQRYFDGYRAYTEAVRFDRNPAMGEALFTEQEPEYNQYIRLGLAWHTQAARLITAGSEQAVRDGWAQLMDWMSQQGVSELEDMLTQRYSTAAQRYTEAGYTLGQPEEDGMDP